MLELEKFLGGFASAGDATENVIGQFREAQRLKRDLEARQGDLEKLKSQPELESMLTAASEPVAASKLAVPLSGE